MITDLKEIAKLAKKQNDANWRFRTFLKGTDLELEEVDAIVHKHYEEVSARIDCRECGNCCRVSQPVLNEDDITKLAIGLSFSRTNSGTHRMTAGMMNGD